MYKFLRLLETARNNGLHGIDETGQKAVYKNMGRYESMMDQCQPIVFYPKNKEPQSLDDEYENHMNEIGLYVGAVKTEDLDAPFKCFSVEVVGQNITVGRTDSEPSIECIIVIEDSPKNYVYFTLVHYPLENIRSVILTNTEAPIVKEFLKRFDVEQKGTEKVRIKQKIGSGSEKKTLEFRRIVHVMPRKTRIKMEGEKTGIEFSHAFWRRGHWRDMPGKVGKDREGVYCVENYTWVEEAVIRADLGQPVTKTRVVSE